MNRSFVVCLAAMVFASAAWASDLPIAAGPFKPTAESLKQYRCPDWFRDAKFGIWAHWGPQAVPMNGDWYARGMYEQGSSTTITMWPTTAIRRKFGYKDIIPLWKAEKWEPEKLMALYKKAGARYFVSQAVHCDNFDLWNSKFHRWNAVKMGPKRDVVGQWQKAAQAAACRSGFRNTSATAGVGSRPVTAPTRPGRKPASLTMGPTPSGETSITPPSTPNGCVYAMTPTGTRSGSCA